MKKITILLLSSTSLFLASCASDSMKSDDMKGMDHSKMKDMPAQDHGNMKM
jgi:uncharacterized protein involved in copper resistance